MRVAATVAKLVDAADLKSAGASRAGSIPAGRTRCFSKNPALQSPLISVTQLSIARGDRVLLEGLSLSVNAGEVLHLRGRNGAGKTSLLEVLAGLRQPLSGEMNRPQPMAVHWLGHKNALNPALTPLENLRFWCGLNGAAVGGIVPALERLGLATLRHRPCAKLSAGQKRRTALVRLLLLPRPLWLLDEPLAGLDTEGLSRFGGLLVEHVDSGGAAIVTSHQPIQGGLDRLRVLQLP